MRVALALAVIAVAWPAALWLHQRHVTVMHRAGRNEISTIPGVGGGKIGLIVPTAGVVRVKAHPSWEDPAALAIALGSLALASGVISYRRV